MADIVDAKTRSRMMSAIRGKNTAPELIVRRFLHAAGFRFRLHARKLSGRPDLVLPGRKTAIFVHGCFWHAHEGCRYFRLPATRAQWWKDKIMGNRERDERNEKLLTDAGWKVLVIWECECRDAKRLARLARAVKSRPVR